MKLIFQYKLTDWLSGELQEKLAHTAAVRPLRKQTAHSRQKENKNRLSETLNITSARDLF